MLVEGVSRSPPSGDFGASDVESGRRRRREWCMHLSELVACSLWVLPWLVPWEPWLCHSPPSLCRDRRTRRG